MRKTLCVCDTATCVCTASRLPHTKQNDQTFVNYVIRFYAQRSLTNARAEGKAEKMVHGAQQSRRKEEETTI